MESEVEAVEEPVDAGFVPAPKRTFVTMTLVVSTTSTGEGQERIQLQDLKVQKKMAKRTVKVSKSLDRKSEALSLDIKRQRLKRLSEWARKYQWTLEAPPANASERPEILAWWREWRDLQRDLESKEMAQ